VPAGRADESLVDAFTSLADPGRLTELRGLAILDTPAEPDYDDLAALASAVVRSPVAAVNFVDEERHFTKAIVGMPEAEGGSVPNTSSFCAATVAEPDGVLVVPDTRTDERWRSNPLVTGGPKVGFYAGASIVSHGHRVGVVCAFGTQPRGIQKSERAALQTLARQAAAQLELRRRNSELRHLALTDPLTGLANRTRLFERLRTAIAERRGAGSGLGVLFLDVDRFKDVNDRYGHEAGDRLLCDIADRLRTVAHDTDTVARIAGDEFVLVCPHLASGADLEGVLKRVTASLQRGRPMPDGSPAPRLSIGAVLARDGERPADLLRRSDAAMYSVKRDR
jgi:diguanylate cyclase (GGDEF)-like protein